MCGEADVWLRYLPSHRNSRQVPGDAQEDYRLPPGFPDHGGLLLERDFSSSRASHPPDAEPKALEKFRTPHQDIQEGGYGCPRERRAQLTSPGARWVQALLPNDAHVQGERKLLLVLATYFKLNPRKKKMRTIHRRKSSHKPYNINSSRIALIQFAGKVNLSHNIPLYAQCLRNFPLPCLFLMYVPFDLHIAQICVRPPNPLLKIPQQGAAET